MKSGNSRYQFLCASAIALGLAAPLDAVPGNGKGGKNKHVDDSWTVSAGGSVSFELGDSVSGTISAGISNNDARRLAVDYGLTGADPLPYGIRKNLARGKPMPPGIAKKHMSGPFVEHLPYHEGYSWQQAGSDLLLVAAGTLIVADILEHVFD